MGTDSEWTVGPLAVQLVPLCLYSLLAANSQFRIPIGQKMQLTGCDNANHVRNIYDMRGYINFNRVVLLSIRCTVTWACSVYEYRDQWRSQPDNFVPLCKFKIYYHNYSLL